MCGRVPLASSGWRPGLLPNTLLYILIKYVASKFTSLEAEEPWANNMVSKETSDFTIL